MSHTTTSARGSIIPDNLAEEAALGEVSGHVE